MLRFKPISSKSFCFRSSIRFCSTTTVSQQQQHEQQQFEFKSLFWSPINKRQLDQNGKPSPNFVKESPQKFQMVGHLEKLSFIMKNSAEESSNHQTVDQEKIFSWLGVRTNNPQVVEDFLIFICAGFDIRKVDCENNFFLLEHSRNFLGWKPKPLNLPTSDSANIGGAEKIENNNPNFIQLPFQMDFNLVADQQKKDDSTSSVDVTTTTTKFSHVHFECPLLETFQKTGSCPNEVLDCLDNNNINTNSQNREAVKMVVALRKAGVRPEIISWRALKSATKKTSSWASALGVM
jgi:hypothetical protein